MGSFIRKIEYFLPANVVTNKQLEKEFCEWNAEKIENKVGIRRRHIVKENETALDLAFEASKRVFENYDKNRIDFVLLCTQSPGYYLPSGVCILQNKLGLDTDIGAFDFNLGCSGFIYGLAIAKSLINSGIASNVLLVTAETYTKYIHLKDKSNRTIKFKLFKNSRPKTTYRAFVEGRAEGEITDNEVRVEFKKRSFDPMLMDWVSSLGKINVPWMKNKNLSLYFEK